MQVISALLHFCLFHFPSSHFCSGLFRRDRTRNMKLLLNTA